MADELPFNPIGRGDATESLGETTLKGQVTQVVFASDDGNYAVIRVTDTRTREEHVWVGALVGVMVGQDVEARGSWERHKTYGRQFRVTYYEVVLPSTEDGMRRYLSSGIIPGVGPTLANRIVDHFGAETLKVLEHYSARLVEVPGFGKGRLEHFRKSWSDHHERRGVFIFLQGAGIGPAYCERIYRKYGQESIRLVQENPYRLATDIHGIGFRMADTVARNLDIAPDNPFRLGSGVVFVLDQACHREGHVCVPRHPLVTEAAEVLEVKPELADQGLERAVADGAVTISAEGLAAGEALVYPTVLYSAECELAKRVKLLLEHPPLAACAPDKLPVSDAWERYNDAQCQAVATVFQHGLSIITGGPGVGKTTVTREIVQVAKRLGLGMALAAPTGRAAKRLSEATGENAKTLHRLLRWEPDQQGFVHGPDQPLPVQLLIVDEVSMVDLRLATSLFRALQAGTRVVLVGDRDQLPSVGPGAVLHDLLESRLIPTTHLTEVYRQEAGSRIITAAHEVNHGEMPDLRGPRGDDELRDFYWIEQDDPDKVVDLIRRLVGERIPARFGLSPHEDVQVLTPMNKGTCGAYNLNLELQAVLNKGDGKTELKVGETAYRRGDRVMQIVNNYENGVFNGDLGWVDGVDMESRELTVQFDIGPVTYASEDLHQLRLAYAITIHKSQGCEFPAVIVPLLTQHYVMLQRRLVYTAMTRAGRLLILIGARRALTMAIRNLNQPPRYSRLKYRLQAT